MVYKNGIPEKPAARQDPSITRSKSFPEKNFYNNIPAELDEAKKENSQVIIVIAIIVIITISIAKKGGKG